VTRTIGKGAVLGFATAALAICASQPASAQTSMVTITFKLTVNFNFVPAKPDSFAVSWGETGINLCGPCTPALSLGGARSITYQQTMPFPKGVTETFVFTRGPSSGGTAQRFGSQTVTTSADRTVSGFFTYGAAAVSTPSTGIDSRQLWPGVAVASAGVVLVVSGLRTRKPAL
jgi:hypothetical protein